MSVTVEKRCRACGTDVSQGRRAKDAAGNYLCEPCLRTARARQQVGGTAVGTATPPQVKACANCGLAVGALQETWDWKGHQVCLGCREALRSEADQRAREAAEQAAAHDAAARGEAGRQAQAARAAQAQVRTRRGLLVAALMTAVLGIAFFAIHISTGSKADLNVPVFCGLGCFAGTAVQLAVYRRRACVPLVVAVRRDLLPVVGFLAGQASVGVIGFVVVCVVLVLPFAGGGIAFGLTSLAFGTDSPLDIVAAIIGAGVGGFAALLLFTRAREVERGQCPACGAWLKSVVERRDLVGRDVRTVEGTREVRVREGQFSFGRVIANLKMPTSRTVVTNRYAVQRRCRACDHRWITR